MSLVTGHVTSLDFSCVTDNRKESVPPIGASGVSPEGCVGLHLHLLS